MSGGSFIGFISERELERRATERQLAAHDGTAASASHELDLLAGSRECAETVVAKATGASANESGLARVVSPDAAGASHPPRSPEVIAAAHVPRSPGPVARDALRVPDSPNRRLRSPQAHIGASASLPHLPLLPEPAAAGSAGHVLAAMTVASAAASQRHSGQLLGPVPSTVVQPAHPPQLLLAQGGVGGADDLGRCGVGLLCEKERGAATGFVREVLARGSAAREGSIQPGDLVVSVDGANISQWNTATLRNALQGEQGTQVTLEISRQQKGQDRLGGERSAVLTVSLLRGSPMFWYWHDKTAAMAGQMAELKDAVQLRDDQLRHLTSELQQAQEAHRAEEGRVARLQIEVGEKEAALREERLHSAESYEARIADLQEQVTEATRRAQDEIKARAVLAREYQHKIAEAERGASEMMAEKIEACDRLLSEQAQEHAAALMRATSHHQEMLRRAEEQLMQRNQELETALNKQASEWNESSARRIAVEQDERDSLRRQHEADLDRLRSDVETRVNVCAVLEADKTLAEAEAEALKREAADLKESLRREREERMREAKAALEERDRREADTEMLHKRCLQALRGEMQRAADSFATERNALHVQLKDLQKALDDASAQAAVASAQARTASVQARAAAQDKQHAEELLEELSGKGSKELSSAIQAEQQATLRAHIERVHQMGEARVSAVEVEMRNLFSKVQRDLDSLAAQGVSHMPAGIKGGAGLGGKEHGGQVGALTAKVHELTKELDGLRRERDALKAERERILALPNPCGVGLKLAHRCGGDLYVDELVPGMSAHTSGAVTPQDILVAIDDQPLKSNNVPNGGQAGADSASSASLKTASRMLVGKRGSQVKLSLLKGGTGSAVARLDVTLKRGAWGPEHAVVEVERTDMLDLNRWPTPA